LNDRKRLLAFYCNAALFYLAANFAHPVTPTFIVERQLDDSMFGVALAAMQVMNFLFAPFWGKLCNYMPVKRITLIGLLGYALGQGIFCSAQTELVVIAGRMVAGAFSSAIFVSLMNYVINVSTDPVTRGHRLTTLVTIQNVASACGYFVGGMLGVISVECAFIVQVVTLVACGFLGLWICVDDTPFKHIPEKPLTVKEANPFQAFVSAKTFMTPLLALIYAVVAVTSIGQNSFDQCFNYFIKDQFDLSSVYNGVFKAAIAAATLLLNSTVCVWLQKKTDINKTFLPITVCGAISALSILIFRDLVPFVAADIVFFALNAVRLSLTQNLTAMHASFENSNLAMGFYQSMISLGGIFGALFAGLIYEADPMLPFGLAFASFAAASVIGVIFIAKYKKTGIIKK